MNGDIVSKIIEYENGEMDKADTLDFFAELGNTGYINHLQGSYGRAFHYFISAGDLAYVDGRYVVIEKAEEK